MIDSKGNATTTKVSANSGVVDIATHAIACLDTRAARAKDTNAGKDTSRHAHLSVNTSKILLECLFPSPSTTRARLDERTRRRSHRRRRRNRSVERRRARVDFAPSTRDVVVASRGALRSWR